MPIVKQITLNLLNDKENEIHEKAKAKVGNWTKWVKEQEKELVGEDLEFGLTQEEINDSLHIEVESGQ